MWASPRFDLPKMARTACHLPDRFNANQRNSFRAVDLPQLQAVVSAGDL